nr:hypothetical protein [Streptomyces sp. LUP30]
MAHIKLAQSLVEPDQRSTPAEDPRGLGGTDQWRAKDRRLTHEPVRERRRLLPSAGGERQVSVTVGQKPSCVGETLAMPDEPNDNGRSRG